MLGFELFFQLLVGHALGDFVLQSDAMGSGKNRHNNVPRDADTNFPRWYYWLSAHSLVHGGIVYLLTGSLVLGLVETFAHALIDFLKCEGKIGMNTDQALHILCKIGYVFVVLA